ncbi:MAG: hypothetical protein HYV09_05815 [Deltaproteobacteria bacterium]|nr:hypothetical protein [Deltaproteobacteria bacterium]
MVFHRGSLVTGWLALAFAVSGCESLLGDLGEFRLREDAAIDDADDGSTDDTSLPDTSDPFDASSDSLDGSLLDTRADTAADACDAAGADADPDNCGACGHSCLGGACAGGRCQPLIVAKASTGETLYSVTADPSASGYVFFSAHDATKVETRVIRQTKDGSPSARFQIFSDKSARKPVRIAWTSSRVIATLTDDARGGREGGVVSFRSDGTDAAYRPNIDRPWRLAVLPTEVYLLNDGDPDIVARMSPVMGGYEPLYGYLPDAGAVVTERSYALAVQASVSGFVFFSLGSDTYRVGKSTIDGGPLGLGIALALAVDEQYLYLAKKTALVRTKPSGCPTGTPSCPLTLVTGTDLVDVILEGGVLYYGDRGTGEIGSVRIDGTDRKTLATGITQLIHLAADDSAIFFVTPTQVGKVAR